ncbi:hypothetical protein [Palleronia sp. LCG004]|nr:hypothetical protein [Palleronia sp. LCG004]WOI57069.1 hypothetical protein RVY76_04575 [Palleronia sp. LCG004]
MTFFELIVPIIALAFAGGGILYIRYEDRKLDRKLEAQHTEPRIR